MHVLVCDRHQKINLGCEILPNFAPEKYEFNLYKVPFMGKKKTQILQILKKRISNCQIL
jgi:hypothetical protein